MKIAVILTAVDRMSSVVDKTISKTQRRMKNFAGGVNKFGNAAIAIGSLGTAFFGASLKAAADMETLQVALNTSFQGNEAAAKAAFATIKDFASKTPYQLNEVMSGFIKLKNMGLDPSIESLTAYGNTASAMGKSLNDMVEAVADAATGEFERLKEFGIRSSSHGDKVTFTFNKVSTTVGKNAAEIEAYLKKIGMTKFAGGIDKQSKTLAGKMSTLKDNVMMMAASIGNTFIPMINRLFDKIGPIMERMQLWIDEHPELVKWIGYTSVALLGVGIVAKGVALIVSNLTIVFKVLKVVMITLTVTLKTVGFIFSWLTGVLMANPIILIITLIALLAFVIIRNWKHIGPFFQRLLNKVVAAFSRAWEWIKGIPGRVYDWIVGKWNQMTTFFSDLWSDIKNTASNWWNDIMDTIMYPIELIKQAWDKLRTWFKDLWEDIKGIAVDMIGGPAGVANGAIKRAMEAQAKAQQAASTITPAVTTNFINSPSPSPIPVRTGGTSSFNIAPVYNVTANSEMDFERLLKNNTDMLSKTIAEAQRRRDRTRF